MKALLIVLLTLVSVAASFGQKVSIGTEVGLISSINSDYQLSDIQNRRNSFYSGININYKYNSRLGFTTGFHYLRQGYRHSTCYFFEEGVKNQLIGKIDYLAIPITANIHMLKSRKLVFNMGILGTYNIQAVQDHPEPLGGCAIYYIPDLTDFTRDYAMTGILGIGYKMFENSRFEVVSSFKYYQGLTNTFNNPFPDTPWNIDRKYSSTVMTISFNCKL